VRRLLVQVIRSALAASPDDAPASVALGACATTSGQEFWVAYQGALGSEPLRHMQNFFAGRTDAAPTGSLGLVLIRRLVEHLEGSVSLEAVPGTGAVFTVALDR
jgi:C4-dicarboxylate-specific signal transduction histidine kinase